MLETDRLTLPDWLDVAARSAPNTLALTFEADTWTFPDLHRSVAAAAEVLEQGLALSTPRLREALGTDFTTVPPSPVEPGEGDRGMRVGRDDTPRLGILSANRPGYVFAVHAARWLGIPFVPLNWRQTARELAWQLRDADIGLLLTDQIHQPVAEEACKGLRATILPISELEQIDPTIFPLNREHVLDLAIEAAILYTSGTSGQPKGARLTHGNFWHSAVASALHLGHRGDDVWLATLPLFHVGGLSILLRSVIGCTPVILHDRFEPERALAAIDDGATFVSLVPTMLRRLLAASGEMPWPESLRCILLGGSAAPPDLIAECLQRGIPVAPTYGLTETASQVTTLRPTEVHRKPRSSGLPLPTTRVRIADATREHESLPVGEIEIQGPTIFTGYLDHSPSEQDCTADGWLRTGDVGYLDEEGYLYVVDRRDDLIVSGGENVYPAEVERVLLAHPHVLDAGVTTVPEEDWGARPIAGVVWQGNEIDVEKSLREHCAAHLARYKVPERTLVFNELPRSASGKLLRRRLRAMILERMKSSR